MIASDEEAVFLEALQKTSPDSRADFLNQACGGDDTRRKSIELLLKAHERAGDFLHGPAACAGTMDQTTIERVGSQIGRYKLLEQVGEGGMGVVYVAEQTDPVRRRVALKIIKPGMDTKQVIARFEAERQALAMMDHPNIAKILDAGTTGEGASASGWRLEGQMIPTPALATSTSHSAGRPYFVMELVRGMPVTEYCDKTRLSPRQRLELFIDVCQAVQHAHQKGIIHRDLKPSNVMVTMQDGRPVAKVIDFGVAKAVGQQLTERTVYTALTQLVGTPLYMSPEQADFSSQDVDTRSDVYSLGVLLYELLTGQTPFDKETLTKAGFDEMRRIIREDEPPSPSRRFSTLSAQASSTVSQHRSVDERHLGRVLRGELDWIVMKALEKDRSRRYESASALAADIQRYLSDEPVLACPPTTMYRFQKFARKHKPALATAAAIAICLILGTTVSAWQAARATTAEAQANANEQKAVANEQKANANAAQAQTSAQEAKEKAQEATAQRDEAQKQRDEVKALYEKLQATQSELRSTLYASNMNLARHAWDANDIGRLQELLAQHRPKSGESDLRGFEWRYLYRQSHAEILDLKFTGYSVAYSPDGKRLAIVGEDAIKVFDAQTGWQLLTLKGGTVGGNWHNCVAFSPDGKRLAGPGEVSKQEMKVWDAETGQELVTFKGNASGLGTLAFSPDGKRVATAGWLLNTALPSGQRIGNNVNAVNVWDAQSGEQLLSVKTTRVAGSMAFSPDGKQLACGTKVFDAQTGKEVFDLKQTGDTCVCYSPDGKRLATATRGGRGLRVWDAQTGQEILTIQAIPDGVKNVAYSPDGKQLAGACNDSTVRVWDALSGQEIFTIKGTGWANEVAYSPDGKRLVSNGDTVKVWDAQKDQRPLTLKATDGFNVASVAFSPDGKRLASSVQGSSSKPAEVKVWDTQTGNELFALKVGSTGRLGSVAYSPDGKRLATDGEALKIWDAVTGQELLSLAHDNHDGRGNDSLAFSPDGKRVATCSGMRGGKGPGYVKVWDAQTGKELLTINDANHVHCVTFSPDGKRLACGVGTFRPSHQEVKVWDAQTGQELLSINAGARPVAFSPDGKRLAGSSGGRVMVWDAQTGKELLKLTGGSHGLTFSPDGKRLVSAAGDNTVKVYDAQAGQELFTFEGHGGYYNGVAFSPDGNRLAAGGPDGTVKIYDATPLPEKP